MKYGIMIVPEDRWSQACLKWKRAEDLGFDHAWTYDHLNWRAFKDRDWFTSVPTLAAAAVQTSRITIGVLVASPNLRHPVQLAKDMTTVADISGQRLVLGLGAGGEGFDAFMTRRRPWKRTERTDRFLEYVKLLDQLLTQHQTSFDGRFYYADQVFSHPLEQPRPPFAIAAAGKRGMSLTAQHGQYWVTMGQPNVFEDRNYTQAVATVRQQVQELEQACYTEGRDPSTVRRLLVTGPNIGGVLTSKASFYDAAGQFESVGITDFVVQWPRPEGIYQAEEKVLDAIAADLPSNKNTNNSDSPAPARQEQF